MKFRFIGAVVVVLGVLSLASGRVLSHGMSHPGGHRDAFGADCLKPIYKKGMLGAGFWKNTCSIGVNVNWNLKNKFGTCKSASYSSHPCAAYVKANSRISATIEGAVNWMACKASTYASGPFPVSTGKNSYVCKHIGYFKANANSAMERHRYRNGYYLGHWSRGAENGYGVFVWKNGKIYAGQWRDGKRNGYGMFIWPGGHRFIGRYFNGKIHGYGTYTWPNGDTYSGRWKNGKRLGRTAMVLARIRYQRYLKAKRERELREYRARQWELTRRRELERQERIARQRAREAWQRQQNTINQGIMNNSRKSRSGRPTYRSGSGRCTPTGYGFVHCRAVQ